LIALGHIEVEILSLARESKKTPEQASQVAIIGAADVEVE
jgi:hypothetical protein